MINDKQIEEALKNIEELKKAVKINLADLRPSFISENFAKSILVNNIIFSIATIICAIATYQFGTILKAPMFYKVATITITLISVIYIFTKKMKALKSGKNNTFKNLIKHKAFNKLYLNILFSLFSTLILFLALKFQFDGIVNINWTLIPLLIISYGINICLSGNALFIKEYTYTGYFSIIIALITLLFFRGSIILWTMIDLTIILFIFYFATKTALKRYK